MKSAQLGIYAAAFGTAAAVECTSSALSTIVPGGSILNFATKVATNGTFQPPGNATGPSIQTAVNLPALCAISVTLNSGTNASYSFGLFLPEAWNGRFLAVGNGGFAGGIQWNSMASGVGYGFAVASTDTGHSASASGATWAYHNPDAIQNWAFGAVHGTAVNAKQVIKSYYQKNVTYSYWRGCSTGGRQGFKSAQMFPEDFDGIVAGAPAWWTMHLQLWNMYVGIKNLPVDAPYHISRPQIAALSDEALKQCDAQDGVKDNIVSSPRACIFHPETLLCGPNTKNSSTCFTNAQLDTVYSLYSDWFTVNQSLIFPHLELGSESQWDFLISGSDPVELGTDYVKYMLNLGPNWSWRDWDPSIISLSERLNPGNATANNYDMSPFQKRGGKILHYHGWSDGLIATGSSTYLYSQIQRTMQPKGANLDDFYRYFLVPGLQHCSGTPANQNAPWYFAGDGQSNALGRSIYGVPGFEGSSQHDVLLAVMAWVENGTAPNHIIGTKYVDDARHDKVYRQRPLCMYPKEARYIGSGDINQASNWKCQDLY